MVEVVKRLKPTGETLRRLYAYSGNMCAFPGCYHLMLDPGGKFIGQVCHIEAAMPEGERFNSGMTNEGRRHFDNLMLLCYPHHIETNDIYKYSVSALKDMKSRHERMFSEDIVIKTILDQLKDYTKDNSFTEVNNLNNFFKIINPNDKYGRTVEMVEDDVQAFNLSIKRYLTLTPFSKRIFVYGIQRSHHPHGLCRLDEDRLYVDFREVCRMLGRYDNDGEIWSSISEIEAQGLMHRTGVYISEDIEEMRHVYTKISSIDDYDENIWLLLKKYCELSEIDLIHYLEVLDFSDLDN